MKFAFHGRVKDLLRNLGEQDVADLTVNDPSLEEVFLAFYGKGGR